MTPVETEMDRLREAFGEFKARVSRVEQPLTNIDDMQAELRGLTASVTSGDETVTVVAGPGGSVQGISLSTMAMRHSSTELEAILMSTLRQAVAEAARKQAAVVEQHLGDGMRLAENVMQTQATALGTSVEVLRSAVDKAESNRDVVDEDDDYSQLSIKTDTGDGTAPEATAGDAFLRSLFDKGQS